MKIEITNQTNGVKAFLSGFNTSELNAKIEACQNGQCECECDPMIMQKIDKIELTTIEGCATVSITGDVDAQTLAPMMQSCLLGEKQ
ncbi:MAG: hypothetical protein CJD30_06860 [Sulfuricurvum sp. PD_MW2]|jgi:hypothetical protein|uniref:hypothetical protein n=1 Tax=Sulfuricurvum sp. PD_MW2 TaxID=2027917 RepID=UPI000C060C7C|nr:hypothetical protein [Sulfuricurvum sp. PD_MW2]PHM17344.1 MAG: hypothetical protein CJD30_06860 [Sulfuricurvum sp. PD_MW2]